MGKRIKPGDRVGAFLSLTTADAQFLGYGVYVGDEVPPNEGANSMTSLMAEQNVPNPKILLDNGDVVWGCECWWGSETEIQAEVGKHPHVQPVRIADVRQAPSTKKHAPMGDFFGSSDSDSGGSGGFWN